MRACLRRTDSLAFRAQSGLRGSFGINVIGLLALIKWVRVDRGDRALENDYHRWLRKTQLEIYQQIFPDTGANENAELSNRARTGTPIDHVPKEAHYSHWVAERAIDFIADDRAEVETFFLTANFFDPHHSFGAPQIFRDTIDADAIPAPNTKPNELSEKPAIHRALSEKSYSGTSPGFQDYTAAEINEIRAQYWAMIALIDYEVGRILEALVNSGQLITRW